MGEVEGLQLIPSAMNTLKQRVVAELQRLKIIGGAVNLLKKRRIAQVDCVYPVSLIISWVSVVPVCMIPE